MKQNPKNLAVAAFLVSAMAGAQAADPAVFDGTTGTLSMPVLQIETVKYHKVVIKLVDFGVLKTNDASVVDADIQFVSTGNVLRLPQLNIGKDIFTKVTLTNPSFVLVSSGDAVADPPSTGTGGVTLDVRVTAGGVAQAPVVYAYVSKPLNQQEFCSDLRLRDPITQTQQQGMLAGNWTVKSCSFNAITGTGAIAMSLSVSGFAVPYSATYTYR